MRRRTQAPVDLVPMMGLATVLVPLLLVGQGDGIAVIEAGIPQVCGCLNRSCEEGMVPLIELTGEGVELLAGDRELHFSVTDLSEISYELGILRDRYQVSSRVVVMPASGVEMEQVVSVMDAARPYFPVVTLVSGIATPQDPSGSVR